MEACMMLMYPEFVANVEIVDNWIRPVFRFSLELEDSIKLLSSSCTYLLCKEIILYVKLDPDLFTFSEM